MIKKLFRKLNQQRGSATIEACISFTGFLFVIFTILGTVNFCRTQMLISNAVDTAARELSQYAYFYKMSGLQKFSSDLSKNAEVGKENINTVIGTVDHLYSSVGSSVKGTVQQATDLYNATTTGNLNMTTVETAITNVDTAGTNVLNSIQSVQGAFEQVADDPLLYMRSLVAIAGETALDSVKSHVIAVPLSRMFFQKHFGGNRAAADAKLEALGVKDGLDGMNFNMSTVFHSGAPNDIEIVVFYRMEIVQLFDWAILEADVSKVAVTGAWLAGDHPQASVKKESSAAAAPSTNTGNTGSADAEGETTPGETTPGETTPATEPATEPPTEPPVDIEDSYWYMDTTYGDQQNAFLEELYNDDIHNITNKNTNGVYLKGYDANNGIAYGMETAINADELGNGALKAQYMLHEDIKNQEKKYRETNGKEGIEPGTIKQGTLIVYVPENISNEELIEMRRVNKLYEDAYYEKAKQEYGDEAIRVTVMIVKAGGNFDYG